jgi:PAS domain S-box-containing protein
MAAPLTSRGYAAAVILIAGSYFLAGKLGLSLAYVNASASAVWPPTGIAVAALLLFGTRLWPAIFAGAVLVNLTTSGSVWASIAIASGNTLEAVTAVWLVVRFAGGRLAFERTRYILRFTALAALTAPLIAASIGTAALLAAGLATMAEAPSIWITWWLGDAVGTIVVAPLIILWKPPSLAGWTASRAIEALALAAAVVISAIVVFGDSPVGAARLPIEWLAVPVLLWAAFRFGAWTTSVAAAMLSAFAIGGTMRGFGPFVLADPNDSLILLQAFIGVITIVMLAAAAEVAMRRNVEREMRSLNQALEQRVGTRTAELARVHARLIEAQQVAHVGSWEWDMTTNTLWWSEQMCRIYGLEQPPAGYEEYLALVHPFDRVLVHETVHRASVEGTPIAFDHRIIRPDGTVRTLHAEGRVAVGPDGRVVRMVGTGHDVTERAAAEQQRAQLLIEQAGRRDAEKASRAKDQFLATLSHELRTPLNVAVGWAQLLRSTMLPEPRSAAAVQAIYRNLQLLARLVSDIIDVSRITAGAFTLESRTVDLSTVIQGAVDTVRDTAAARGMSLVVRMPPEAVVTGDDRRLQQVVWNLLSNAVKFGRDGGCVTLSVAAEHDAVTIVVEDDGQGIAPEFLPHVFDEFRQQDASHTRQHGGLGLGLSIARHLVELHGGSITAANRVEGGAMFTVRLPADVMQMTN